LNGLRIGGAPVSPVHAHFFINLEGDPATASDYYALIRNVQDTVFAQTGTRLEPEIEMVGDWSDSGAHLAPDPTAML